MCLISVVIVFISDYLSFIFLPPCWSSHWAHPFLSPFGEHIYYFELFDLVSSLAGIFHLTLPDFLGLFLWIMYVSYISWPWKSGFMQKVCCGPQWHTPRCHPSWMPQWWPLCGHLRVSSCCGWAATDAGVRVCGAGPQSRSHFGGAWFQPGPPARWGGVGAALGGTGSWGITEVGCMVLARLMESDRYGACQHQARLVILFSITIKKKMVFSSTSIPRESSTRYRIASLPHFPSLCGLFFITLVTGNLFSLPLGQSQRYLFYM